MEFPDPNSPLGLLLLFFWVAVWTALCVGVYAERFHRAGNDGWKVFGVWFLGVALPVWEALKLLR